MFNALLNGLERDGLISARLGTTSEGTADSQRALHKLSSILCCDVHFRADGLAFSATLTVCLLLALISGIPLSLKMLDTNAASLS